jgi:NAD(P)-dependent dehydrogenase (short-subunit alcohol dehydrogenase family)
MRSDAFRQLCVGPNKAEVIYMSDITNSFKPGLFDGKTVLVSGASRGIGLGIAEGFAKLGAKVLATGLNADRTAEGTTDPNITFHEVDVRDRKAVKDFVGGLSALDVVVNVAGIARPRDEYEEDVYMEVMDVNLNSVMWVSNAARPMLAKTHGSIISVASMLSYLADPDVPAYCASKTGVIGLTRSLAFEFGPEIRVNAVAPGYHKTDMTRVHWENPEVEHKIGSRAALNRWGSVDDVVGAVLFLASPAAQFITATTLPVDGGYSVG